MFAFAQPDWREKRREGEKMKYCKTENISLRDICDSLLLPLSLMHDVGFDGRVPVGQILVFLNW